MVQMEKCSSQQSTFLVVGRTDLLVFEFYNPSREESVHIKYVSIKDSLPVGICGTYWSDQCMNGVQVGCTQEYEITCCAQVMLSHHFDRQVSGACMDCKVLSLALRSIFLLIALRGDW